jgi:hypothetical protein
MDCAEYYRVLYKRQGEILDATCASSGFTAHAESHQFLTDLQAWCEVLAAREEVVLLRKAKNEFQAGLSLLATGHYRYAFVSLRSSLELSLAHIEHSANFLFHLQWKNGRKDIVWSALVDSESGVLSSTFSREFAPALASEATHVTTLARSVYRTCSEYAHGNALLDDVVPPMFEFSDSLFGGWHVAAGSVRYVIMFALVVRYLERLSVDDVLKLEQCLQEQMGHLQFVRDVLARAKV